MKKSLFYKSDRYLKELISRCKDILDEDLVGSNPEGTLNISGNRFVVYLGYENGRRKYKRISRSSKDFDFYVRKYCAKRILEATRKDGNVFNNIDEAFEHIEDIFKTKFPKFCISRRTIIRQWQEEKFHPNPYHTENKIYKTRRGDMVRSKSECLIADELFARGIPYKIEAPIKAGGRIVYPDFTVLDPKSGYVYFIEACGMMQDEIYVKGLINKINDYAESGITVGDQLILFMESIDVPLNLSTIRITLDNLMLTGNNEIINN